MTVTYTDRIFRLSLSISLTIFILQVLTTYTNLSRFCFLGTAPVLARNVWANEKIPKLTPAPENRTRDLKIARPTLYLTTTDTTIFRFKLSVSNVHIFTILYGCIVSMGLLFTSF